ncbi:MAG: hypothetical protein F6J87_30715 [Spirulina sp. SIO3F2]|nr:hypothetical protein [Spirulina sp. SIO3F2]
MKVYNIMFDIAMMPTESFDSHPNYPEKSAEQDIDEQLLQILTDILKSRQGEVALWRKINRRRRLKARREDRQQKRRGRTILSSTTPKSASK